MPILVFQHGPLTGPDRLGATLLNYGHRLHVVRQDDPNAGDPMPRDLDDVDSVLVMGGCMGASDERAWLDDELAMIREADQRDLPLLGICLGSQLVARALGGTVSGCETGMELGFHDIHLLPPGREDPLFAGLGWTHTQFHWHQDCVTELPADARLLASSDKCAHQAWSRGLRTYGLQFHPEVSTCTIEAWMDDSPGDLDRAGVSPDDLRDQIQTHYATYERITQRLFDSIALFLMPLDRRYAGATKDLHH